MKGSLTALALTTTALSSGFADSCCEPCPVSCAYNYPTYNLECAWGLSISADFLYWFGKETGLTYAVKNQTNLATQTGSDPGNPFYVVAPVKYLEMEESWDPGFRVGIGYTTCSDGWDLGVNWTYFHTKDKENISVEVSELAPNIPSQLLPADESLNSPWAAPGLPFAISDASSDILFFNRIQASWKLDYNSVDIEIGKGYWVSPSFSMRPFLGIRGAWTETDFSTTPSIAQTFANFADLESSESIKFRNRFCGWGLYAGLMPKWHFGCGFSIFGNVDAALLYGNYRVSRKSTQITQLLSLTLDQVILRAETSLGKSRNCFTHMQAILDLGAGLSWEKNFCCDRYRFGLDLGWEHHLWFDHNHRHQLRGSYEEDSDINDLFFTSYLNTDETYGNLMLAGFTLRARFDF